MSHLTKLEQELKTLNEKHDQILYDLESIEDDIYHKELEIKNYQDDSLIQMARDFLILGIDNIEEIKKSVRYREDLLNEVNFEFTKFGKTFIL